uniref:Uncharacterized protein n=1 Tax=Romanomermis culicivorax TaxID=13658 RepID=A0A915L1Q8_ROMCU
MRYGREFLIVVNVKLARIFRRHFFRIDQRFVIFFVRFFQQWRSRSQVTCVFACGLLVTSANMASNPQAKHLWVACQALPYSLQTAPDEVSSIAAKICNRRRPSNSDVLKAALRQTRLGESSILLENVGHGCGHVAGGRFSYVAEPGCEETKYCDFPDEEWCDQAILSTVTTPVTIFEV